MTEREPHAVPRGLLRFYILRLLSEKPMKGYEVITRIEERTEGFWKPGPGSIYPMIESMKSEGLIQAAATAKKEVSGKSGNIFRISEKGRKVLEKFRENVRSRMHMQAKSLFRIFGDIVYPGLEPEELALAERRRDIERLKSILGDEYWSGISTERKRKFFHEYSKLLEEELEFVRKETSDTEVKG